MAYDADGYKDGDVLEELHHNQRKTLAEIAELFDVTVSTVWRHAQLNGIETSRSEPVKERFEQRYEIDDETGCWEWTGTMMGGGYGQMSVNNRNEGAHRISYRLHNGEIPEGAFICHTCHNPPCVNPDHLYAGDAASNAQDAIENGDWPEIRGSDTGNSELTEDDVREMRGRYADGEVTYEDLKREYDVSLGTVSRAIRGIDWEHVDGAVEGDWKEWCRVEGSEVGTSKLTENDVREIRRIYAEQDISMADLGERVDVSASTVSGIVNRDSWKHVD